MKEDDKIEEKEALLEGSSSPLTRFVSAVLLLIAIFLNHMDNALPNSFIAVEIVEVRGLPVVVSGVITAACPATTSLALLFSTWIIDKLSLSFKKSLILVGVFSFLPSLIFVFPIPNSALFVVLVLLVRLIQGAVQGIVESQLAGLLFATYPDKLGLISALTEFAFIGSIGIGSVAGTALYSAGNIGLPFVVVGGAILVMSAVNYYFPHPALNVDNNEEDRPTDVESPDDEEINEEIKVTEAKESRLDKIARFLQNPNFCIGFGVTGTLTLMTLIYDNFLGLYFVQVYDVPVSDAGVVILLGTLVYGVSTIVFGWLTDNCLPRFWCLVVGSVVHDISTLLYCPLPWLATWSNIIPPSIFYILPVNISYAATFVLIVPLLILNDPDPNFTRASQRAYGVSSASGNSVLTLGPIGMSLLLDLTSFPVMTFVVVIIHFSVMMYVLCVHFKTGNLLTVSKKN